MSSSPPCAACKLQRRKCTQGCVFSPYFPPDQPTKFENVHHVFGASNVAKLLNELPPSQRKDTVNALVYQAEARIRDPVYGCVGLISVLQDRIMQVHAKIHNARKELSSYIGPAAFNPILPPYDSQSNNNYGPHFAGGHGMGISENSQQQEQQQQQQQQQQQGMMMREEQPQQEQQQQEQQQQQQQQQDMMREQQQQQQQQHNARQQMAAMAAAAAAREYERIMGSGSNRNVLAGPMHAGLGLGSMQFFDDDDGGFVVRSQNELQLGEPQQQQHCVDVNSQGIQNQNLYLHQNQCGQHHCTTIYEGRSG